MVTRSRTLGTFRTTTLSEVSSAAAITGSAEFFAPLTATLPRSAFPPLIRNLSIFRSAFFLRHSPLVSHQGQPANCPLPLSFSSLPLSPQLPALASPARRAYCVPPPAERAPPQTHFFRLPPPKSATPASQPFHLSVLHQSSGFHKHVQAAPSSRYSAC